MNRIRKVFLLIREYGIGFGLKYLYFKGTRQQKKYIGLVYKYLTDFLQPQIERYKNEKFDRKCFGKQKNIWVCWWQGKENMPELCRMCYDNLVKNTPEDYTVCLITRNNYSTYADIPEYIVRKLEKGEIPITQFSDILRQALLVANGGVWIDASVWVTDRYTSLIKMDLPFWSVKLPEIDDRSVEGQLVSECKWAGFIMAGKKESLVFHFVYDAMCSYYKEHSFVLDYFLHNYLIRIGYENIPRIKEAIDQTEQSNGHLYELYRYMDKAFEPEIWNWLCDETAIFKLTQKRNYFTYRNDKITFYGQLKMMASKEIKE